MMRGAAVAFAALLLGPRAEGQEMVTRLFDTASDISIFAQAAWLSPGSKLETRGSGLFGYGAEVLFTVADNPRSHVAVELALGYNYLTGFKSSNPDLDLRGSMRTLPELSVYVTYEKLGALEPYVGLHTGLLDLWHVQGYDNDRKQYSIDSESFQGGFTAGAVWQGVWLEGSYRIRNFPSLEWQLPEDITALPAGFPRSLDLSGWNVRLGYQFTVRRAKPGESASR